MAALALVVALCAADVTIHLRGGSSVSGRVTKVLGGEGCVDLIDTSRRETKHTVDLSEIAAVTAAAR